MIKVTYSSIDRFRKTGSFKTLKGARAFAQKWVGKYPELGSTYAVSSDGVGKITASGVALADLFGDEKPAGGPPDGEFTIYIVDALGRYFTSKAEAKAAINEALAAGDGWYGQIEISEQVVTKEDFR